MARKVFWRSRNGYKSVMMYREWQVKCFRISGVARKVFWGRPAKINTVVAYDDSAPFSSKPGHPWLKQAASFLRLTGWPVCTPNTMALFKSEMQLICTNTAWFCRIQYGGVTGPPWRKQPAGRGLLFSKPELPHLFLQGKTSSYQKVQRREKMSSGRWLEVD